MLLQKHAGALRADFLKHYGVRLHNEMRANIFEAADLAANLPKDGTSAVHRAINPEWRWTLDAQLLALNADLLAWLKWSKTKDASSKPPRNMPKPIPRPGIKDKTDEVQGRFKDVVSRPLDELKRRLAKPRRKIS